MTAVFIVDAARTPLGRFRGRLAGTRADHLGAVVITDLLDRRGLDPTIVDDVIFGCVTQVGEQSGNIARTSVLSAGWPESIPGLTVDRKCGSGEAAIHVAAGLIAMGSSQVVIAGGAESMSRVPMGGNQDVHGEALGWKLKGRFDVTSLGEAAERVCDRWKLTRDALDDYAIESHRRAALASDQGYFEREIVPVPVSDWCEQNWDGDGNMFAADETIRRGTSREKLAGLTASFRIDGRLTAGNSSQIADGAAAVLLMSGEALNRLGVKARARIRSTITVGSDPELTFTGPIAATRRVLHQAGLSLEDIDLFEINEAFAPVPLVWMREVGVSAERLNVNGGAIALGHPLGATGARIATSLLFELERRDARYGLQAICCNGGLATATIIERLA